MRSKWLPGEGNPPLRLQQLSPMLEIFYRLVQNTRAQRWPPHSVRFKQVTARRQSKPAVKIPFFR